MKQRYLTDEERYGLTSGQVDRLLNLAKRDRCDICQRRWEEVAHAAWKRPQNIDHCHDCKRVRGVLCFRCNYYVVGVLEQGRYAKTRNYGRAKDYILGGGANHLEKTASLWGDCGKSSKMRCNCSREKLEKRLRRKKSGQSKQQRDGRANNPDRLDDLDGFAADEGCQRLDDLLTERLGGTAGRDDPDLRRRAIRSGFGHIKMCEKWCLPRWRARSGRYSVDG